MLVPRGSVQNHAGIELSHLCLLSRGVQKKKTAVPKPCQINKLNLWGSESLSWASNVVEDLGHGQLPQTCFEKFSTGSKQLVCEGTFPRDIFAFWCLFFEKSVRGALVLYKRSVLSWQTCLDSVILLRDEYKKGVQLTLKNLLKCLLPMCALAEAKWHSQNKTLPRSLVFNEIATPPIQKPGLPKLQE